MYPDKVQQEDLQGPQGVDKDPAEDAPKGNHDSLREAQKGAAKEDGDPAKPQDQAVEKR